MVCIGSTGLRPVIVRYGKHKYKKKRKNIPSHFATQKKGGASALSKLKMKMLGGSTGFIPGAQRRIKPYTKIRRKKKKNPGKRPKRVSPYTRKGGEMFNVWDSQERARERRDKRLKQKAGGSISGCRMGSGGQVTGCHFNV